jgi:hypothetical protein
VGTGERVRATARTFRYGLRYFVNAYPRVYMPLARAWHSGYRDRFVERDTELVIEGFGRSASTFAVMAFEMAQDRRVRLAHHTHASAQVIVAAKRSIPTLVIVRRPMDAALAHMVRRRIPARPALKAWIRFHSRILPYRNRILAVPLESVSTDFGAVTRELNRRFGTSFGVFEHTGENQARVFQTIEAANLRKYGKPTDWVARPTTERLDRKGARRTELDDPGLAALREQAEDLYRNLIRTEGG